MNPKSKVGMGRKEGSSQVEEERKRTIVHMVQAGLTPTAVANHFCMNRSTVYSILHRYKQQGTLSPTETRGRKKKLDERSMRRLMKYAKSNRFKPLHTITAEFNSNNDYNLCSRSVRRYLRREGINNYVAVSKPHLSMKNIRARVEWANLHLHWDDAQWDKVVFSDESSFTVKPVTSHDRVWRKEGTRFDQANMVPTFKSGRSSVSIWAAFSSHGRTPLVQTSGTMNQEKYRSILESSLIPFATEHYGSASEIIFQQDNCGPHRAKSIKAYMEASNIDVMKWPAQSPDINPIENAWAFLKKRVRERSTNCTTADDLFQVLCEEWLSIPDAYFLSLVRSMPKRARALIDNKGRSTKY